MGCPAKNASPNPTGKPSKVQPQAKEMALKGLKVVEFTPSPKRAEGTLTPPEDGQGFTDTDSDDDPLVNDPIMLVMVRIKLSFPGSRLKANLRALLDLGCTRCLVNPALVEKLEI